MRKKKSKKTKTELIPIYKTYKKLIKNNKVGQAILREYYMEKINISIHL